MIWVRFSWSMAACRPGIWSDDHITSLVILDAAVLDGGWDAWTAEGRPVTTAAEPPPAPFVTRPRPGLFVTKEEVLAAIGDANTAIVDALAPEQYRGERQDYARAGHIPGAANVPTPSLVDTERCRYLPPDRLREAFGPVLDGQPQRVITYCGGGVAASSDAFALTILGVDDVAVYDGCSNGRPTHHYR